MAKIIVLGSAAGGGVPQWNCNCTVCQMARDGRVLPRHQSSIAASLNGEDWCVFNCSPDIRQQINDQPALQPGPHHDRRHSPIASVVLTNADVDHLSGLLVLREKQSFQLFATGEVLQVLRDNPIFNVLDPAFVTKIEIGFDQMIEVLPGLSIEAFKVPGKVALFKEGEVLRKTGDLGIGAESGHTIGLKITGAGQSVFYIPGCAAVTADLESRLKNAGLLLFDGTVWQNEEMISQGLGQKTGARMGHMSMAGPEGSMAAMAGLAIGRKIYIHINNSNPVLIEDGSERQKAADAGWEIAYDGMEISF